jgi:membrane-associated PAP2 superfamily phosphatase
MPKLQCVHLLTTKQGRVGTRDKTELGFSRVSMYAIPVISSATPAAILSQSRLLWEDSSLDYRLRNRKYDKRGRQYVNIRATTDILIHRTTLMLAVVKVALFLTCKSLVGLDEHCVVAFCEAHTVRKAAAARAQEVRK